MSDSFIFINGEKWSLPIRLERKFPCRSTFGDLTTLFDIENKCVLPVVEGGVAVEPGKNYKLCQIELHDHKDLQSAISNKTSSTSSKTPKPKASTNSSSASPTTTSDPAPKPTPKSTPTKTKQPKKKEKKSDAPSTPTPSPAPVPTPTPAPALTLTPPPPQNNVSIPLPSSQPEETPTPVAKRAPKRPRTEPSVEEKQDTEPSPKKPKRGALTKSPAKTSNDKPSDTTNNIAKPNARAKKAAEAVTAAQVEVPNLSQPVVLIPPTTTETPATQPPKPKAKAKPSKKSDKGDEPKPKKVKSASENTKASKPKAKKAVPLPSLVVTPINDAPENAATKSQPSTTIAGIKATPISKYFGNDMSSLSDNDSQSSDDSDSSATPKRKNTNQSEVYDDFDE